ncbi:hypothetical protein L1787_19525 [Acuticoccus sp. M5D2P5]|uniref:hypothetical protein n=1 Tax=Acuticoccus kalidii TaxID=2910977 RepID=UPI001F24A8A8|nr:hypothetical protein [Acuticoccus kalidii]MCF3935587.1 hypothetical protein [Acuticoccus kalidii]
MTKPFATLALVLAACGATALPATAQGVGTQFFIAEVDRATPKCRDYPDAPFVGRVSGIMGGSPARGVSFTGCFASYAACETWRQPLSGHIEGRLIQNRCEARRKR